MDPNLNMISPAYEYHLVYNTDQHYNVYSMGIEAGQKPWIPTPEIPNNPILPSMQRYLSEPVRTCFMPGMFDLELQTLHTLPEVPVPAFGYVGDNHCTGMGVRRFSSPSDYTPNSSCLTSEWSGLQESPDASPYLTDLPYSPQHEHGGDVAYAFGGHPPVERGAPSFVGSCVALHDVQMHADEIPDTFKPGTEPVVFSAYGSIAQEGYHPIQSGDDSSPLGSYSTPCTEYPTDAEIACEDRANEEVPCDEPSSPVIRRRRPQGSRLSSRFTTTGRFNRSAGVGRRYPSHRPRGDDPQAADVPAANRAFPCPLAVYGCTSSFGSKNEWKRHVNTQHMRFGYWRCDQCTGKDKHKPNDFNRKDLFTQHVRRMHPVDISNASALTAPKNKKAKPRRENTEEAQLQDAATRCYRHLRSPPEHSHCLFCDQHFHGKSGWDDRMEHIGRHMETAKKESDDFVSPDEWRIDEDAERWFIEQNVIVAQDGELVLVEQLEETQCRSPTRVRT